MTIDSKQLRVGVAIALVSKKLAVNVEGHYAIIIGLIVRLYERKRKIEIIVGVKIRLPVLTASVFETGAMAAPTKLENPIGSRGSS